MPDQPQIPSTPPPSDVDGGTADAIGTFLNANMNPGQEPPAPQPAVKPSDPPPAKPPAAARPPDPPVGEAPVKPGFLADMLRAARPGQPEEVAEPAAAEPEAPAEPGGEDDDSDAPPEAQKPGKERNAWTRIKSDLKAEKAQRVALERKVAELEAAPKAKPEELAELENLRKTVSEQEDLIGQIEITRSKSFQQRYDSKVLNARSRLQRSISAFGERTPEEAAQVVQALEQCKTPAEARELLSGESQDLKGVALTGYLELVEAHKERNAAIEDWRNTRPALQTAEDENRTGERLRQIVDVTASTLAKLAAPVEADGDGSWIYMDQPDDPEWTVRRSDSLAAARAVLRDAGVEKITPELAKFVMEGAVAKLYRQFGEAQFARANELQSILDRRNKAMPRLNGGQSEPASKPPAPPAAPQRIEGGIEAGVGQLVDEFHTGRRV